MVTQTVSKSLDAEQFLAQQKNVHRNLFPAELVQHSIRRGETKLASNGALVGETAPFTGRTPKDKFTIRDELTENSVAWGGFNHEFSAEKFDALYDRVIEYLQGKEFSCKIFLRAPIRSIACRSAWSTSTHGTIFSCATFRAAICGRAEVASSASSPSFQRAEFQADPQRDGTNSGAFILVSFTRKIVLIGGTKYAGEMKKSIFGIMNFLLPERNVFPMHCSANVGKDNVTALFFGLSGTGKTTLSADPERRLIGDDEHGWSEPRHLQLRRRLLCQVHQALEARTSRRSGTRSASARCWKMWCSSPARACRITTPMR